MNRKAIPIAEAAQPGFSWMRDPEFTPPGADGGAVACLTHEFAAPRAGELRTLLAAFMESIIGLVGASAGVVRLRSPDGSTLQIIGSAGLTDELQEAAESFVGLDCESGRACASGCVLLTEDISECNARANCRYAGCRFRSLIAAPLEAPGVPGIPFGILTVFFDVPRGISNRAESAVSVFAELMGAAIAHNRANHEARRAELLAERQAIANEIHDSLAQTLTYARMRASLLLETVRGTNGTMATKYAQDLDEALEIGQKSARELITDFRCEMHPGGLLPALLELVAQFRERNGIVLDYHNRVVDLELPLEHEIQTFQIVREALTNIARHSGASHARLFVESTCGYHVFTIEDNGSGTFAPVEGHYGVMIMRERAQRIGGDIRVDSIAGLGTRVQLFFPEPSQNWRMENE